MENETKAVVLKPHVAESLVNLIWRTGERYGFYEGMVYFWVWCVLVLMFSTVMPLWVGFVVFALTLVIGRIVAKRLATKKRKQLLELVIMGEKDE